MSGSFPFPFAMLRVKGQDDSKNSKLFAGLKPCAPSEEPSTACRGRRRWTSAGLGLSSEEPGQTSSGDTYGRLNRLGSLFGEEGLPGSGENVGEDAGWGVIAILKRGPILASGSVADLILSRDWASTPLGSLEGWSSELLALVNAVLASPVPMFLYWGAERVVLYNDAAVPLVSTKHPNALSKPAREVWKEAWHIIGPEVEQAMADGTITNHEGVLVPLERDGVMQDLYWNYSYSAAYENGRIGGVLVICREVTATVLANRERNAIAERLKQVLDATTDSILSIDREWRISFMNPPARKAAGPLADAVGANFWVAFPAAVYEGSPFLKHYYRAMDEGIAGEFEAFYPEPLDIWVRVQVRPTADGIVLFFRDVTEQKKATAALLQTEKLAAVGRLAASIAHEINNPLESVTNLLYLARSSGDLKQAQEYLETAERELRRVSVITNQTLRFYKQSTKPKAVGCQDLFESVLSIYQGRLVNARVFVEKRKRAKAPVLCFEDEIRQVLNNLIGNAIDALHAKGGRLLLRSREATDWRTGRRGLVLTVADTGAGMSPQVLTKMYDAFFTTKGIGGTGLGLWVSQEIVARHQGSLRARSSEREGRSGTVFQLFLPFDAVAR